MAGCSPIAAADVHLLDRIFPWVSRVMLVRVPAGGTGPAMPGTLANAVTDKRFWRAGWLRWCLTMPRQSVYYANSLWLVEAAVTGHSARCLMEGCVPVLAEKLCEK